MKTKTGKVVQTKKVSSLRDLIDKIDWLGIQAKGASSKLPDDAVSIQFTRKDAKVKTKMGEENCDYVRLRFGKDVLEKLNWMPGDRVYISHDPDDQLTFLLCKVESRNGFKLCVESGTTSSRIHFAWRDSYVAIKTCDAQLLEYEIYKNKLIFRANIA